MSKKINSLEDALKVVDQLISVFQGSRADFALIDEAVEFIKSIKQCECPEIPEENKE